MKRLAIITTHPIQYNAPFFKKLAQDGRIILRVFYTWDKGAGVKHDPGFGKKIEWDIPLLEGYEYTFVKNTSKKPGSHHFKGVQNPTLINEVQSFHPDAILVYGWSFQSHLKAMRYFKGRIPVWFRGDSTLLDYDYQSISALAKALKSKRPSQYLILSIQYLKFSLRRLFLSWVYTHIDKAFFVGTNNKNYFLAHRVKEEKLVWLPHAVDNNFFQKDDEKAEVKAKEWRRELGIKDEELVVLFAGKFEPKKNPELLVRAVIDMNEESRKQKVEARLISSATSPNLQIIKSSNYHIHLILVGSGVLEPQLTEMVKGKSYIHFLPFQNQSQMPIVYRSGNVFCLPSQGPGETWGLSINEALACGRPIVASDKVGCAIDLIVEGKTGFMFQSQSNEDLKLALEKIIQAEDMGQNCKDFIQNYRYNSDALFAQFNE